MKPTSGLRLLAASLVFVTAAAVADRIATPFIAGSFKRIAHTGEAPAVAPLDKLPRASAGWGVGALAGMRGELLLHDGALLVTPGADAHGRTRAPEDGEQAALFVAMTVPGWVSVEVPHDMPQAAFEAFVLAAARDRGLDADSPWAFRVVGTFPQLTWHVVTGLRDAPTATPGAAAHAARGGAVGHAARTPAAHANKHASMRVFDEPGAGGQLVGVYSGAALEGIATHPGERFHVHYADGGATRSGHVDAYAVGRGARLMLPVR
jgi:hypothetical protein